MTCQGIGKDPVTLWKQVSPGFFDNMRIPIVEGRAFTDQDIASAPKVAIINQTLASRYFPGVSPLGRTIESSRDNVKMEIVASRSI